MTETGQKRTDVWWYRLLQVVFVILVLGIAALELVGVVILATTVDPYSSSYKVLCDNGHSYGPYRPPEVVVGYKPDFRTADRENFMYRQCADPGKSAAEITAELNNRPQPVYTPVSERPTPGFRALLEPYAYGAPVTKNYHLEYDERTYEIARTTAIIWVFASWIILAIISILLRALFLYIAFKEPIKRNVFGRLHRWRN